MDKVKTAANGRVIQDGIELDGVYTAPANTNAGTKLGCEYQYGKTGEEKNIPLPHKSSTSD